MPEWWDQLWSDPEKLKRLGDQFGAAGAGALQGGMRGGGWRGSLAGFLGGFQQGGKAYDEAAQAQAQAKIAGMKAKLPASAYIPGEVLKAMADQGKVPADLLAMGAGGAPGGAVAPGGPGGRPGAPGAPGGPGGPAITPSGNLQLDQFREMALSGKVPREELIAAMRKMGLNPALLGGFGDRGASAF